MSETDEMAIVGAATTMLLHERLVASPRLAPAALPKKVVRVPETGAESVDDTASLGR